MLARRRKKEQYLDRFIDLFAAPGGFMEPAFNHYFISPFDGIDELSKEDQYTANIKALEVLSALELKNAHPTREQQQQLVRYCGWGGLSKVFEPYSSWSYQTKSIWKARQDQLKNAVNEEVFNSLKRSVTTSYYTPSWIINGLWKCAQKLGFRGGRILEPACGTGRFLGYIPESIARASQITGIELEPVSAKIAASLYPDISCFNNAFEKVDIPDNYYDLVITNVPFGDFRVHDPLYNKFNLNIHNYFLVRSMDKLRPGGIGIFLTSTGTMQSEREGATARKLLAARGKLLAAARFPEGSFGSECTEAACDLLIFLKTSDACENDSSWSNLSEYHFKTENNRTYSKKIARYYIDHPEHQFGIPAVDGRFQRLTLLEDKETSAMSRFANWINFLPENAMLTIEASAKDPISKAWKVQHEGFAVDANNVICKVINGELIPVNKNEVTLYRIRKLISIRDAAKTLLESEISNDDEHLIAENRNLLNALYDSFVSEFGPISLKSNSSVFVGDNSLSLLLSLETIDKRKADIFSMRTVNPLIKVKRVDSPEESLVASLRELGRIDLSHMASLVDKSELDIIASLSGKIYKNPISRSWETADDYLSGDVKAKLSAANIAAADSMDYQVNLTALQHVQPIDLRYDEIDARLGAPWIPANHITNFANHLLDETDAIEVTFIQSIGQWTVESTSYSVSSSIANTQSWGTCRKPAVELLENALNQQIPVVKDTKHDDHRKRDIQVINDKETIAARQQMENIKSEFKRWVWECPERRQELAQLYNDRYNNWRLRNYDGSHLSFPGLNNNIQLRDYQKHAVWRILQTRGATLLGHDVGAGKTYTMQAAGMELKRLGLANRPMYAIPTANFDDFIMMFERAYPLANLLVLRGEDLPSINCPKKAGESSVEYEERRELNRAKRAASLNRIVTCNWDAIVISHEVFRRISVSPDRQNSFIEDQIEDLELAIIEMELEKGNLDNRRIVKRLQSAKERLENRLLRDLDAERRDIAVDFESLAIDALFIDESDQFKNLAFATKMTRVAGVQNSGSSRAMDMYLKVNYLCEKEKTVVFATATPISNTLAEMFTIMRYLSLKELRKDELAHFDSWAASYGEVVTALERTPDGQSWRPINRFSNIINAPELITRFRAFADIKTAEDLNLPRPLLKGGERTIISVEASNALKNYIQVDIMNRVKRIQSGGLDPRIDNMLNITSDMRKASLDIRLVYPGAQVGRQTKIHRLVDNVFNIWEQTVANRSTQVIFCDLSVPKGKSDDDFQTEEDEDAFCGTVYEEIIRLLVLKGIPRNEIDFMQSAKNERQKFQLKEKVRQGSVRILLSSTSKGGVGVNYQDRLIALHHVDAPWRPRDISQREGRILRQGNQNDEVMIFAYVTENSADSWLWQTIKTKARFISQAMSGKLTASRTLADIEQTVLSFAQIEAIATGNPLIVEKIKNDADVEKYTILKSKWQSDQYHMKDLLAALPRKIDVLKNSLLNIEQDIACRIDTAGKNFRIDLQGCRISSRTDAQRILDDLCDRLQKEHAPTDTATVHPIGKFAGFPIFLRFSGKLGCQLFARGKRTYETFVSLQSLEHLLRKTPELDHKVFSEDLVSSERKLRDLNVQINKPFEYEFALTTALQRQQELDEALGIDQPDLNAA